MRDDAPPSLPSEALDADREGPFASDAGVFLWAEEVAREMAWIPEFHPKLGAVLFFPRVAAKGAEGDEARMESELHVRFPFRQRPLEARLVVPAGTLPLDFRNLRQKLYEPTGALEISTTLEGLPDSFRLGVPGSHEPISAVASPDTLRALAQEAFERGLALELTWSFADESSEAGTNAESTAVTDALVALATVGELFAWSEENAYVNPHVSAQGEEPPKRGATDKRSRDASSGARARGPNQEPSERARRAPTAKSTPAETDAPPADTAPVRTPFAFPRTPLKSSSSSSSPAEAPRELGPGARVQVAGGPFLGRLGIVQSVDAAKGQTRVLFGLLAATIASSDLVAVRAPGQRPRLSSSHRRRPS